jgi:hypothetical protein
MDSQEQKIKICNLYALEPLTILVRDFTIQRISSPELVFIGRNESYRAIKKRAIHLTQSTQTAYEMDVEPGESMTLVLYEQYHPEWQLSGTSASHIEVNGFANGWIIPKSDVPTHIRVEFLGQKTIVNGARISLFGISSIFLVGVYAIFKHLTSNK